MNVAKRFLEIFRPLPDGCEWAGVALVNNESEHAIKNDAVNLYRDDDGIMIPLLHSKSVDCGHPLFLVDLGLGIGHKGGRLEGVIPEAVSIQNRCWFIPAVAIKSIITMDEINGIPEERRAAVLSQLEEEI